MKLERGKNLVAVLNVTPMPNKETRFFKGIAYTPSDKKKYMLDVVRQLSIYEGWFPEKRPLSASWIFLFPALRTGRLKTLYKITPPDTDNLVKPIKDCLQPKIIYGSERKNTAKYGAGVILNDSLICREAVRKYTIGRAELNQRPRVILTIRAIPTDKLEYER